MSTVPENLTSDVYSEENPPKDWADIGLLIPHEAIRRQLTAMNVSMEALADGSPVEGEEWKIVYFSEWYLDYFHLSVIEHHEVEEKLYFPWVKERAAYPEKEFSRSHEELVAMMDTMKEACETVLSKKGKDCSNEVSTLKHTVPTFVSDMRTHLAEEESKLPEILRENFTQEEESAVVQKILKGGGLEMMKVFLPAIILAMEEWGSPEFYKEFMASMPPPVRHLTTKYFIPDFKNVAMQMRDAPTMETKPKLAKVGCCGISFCFPCIL